MKIKIQIEIEIDSDDIEYPVQFEDRCEYCSPNQLAKPPQENDKHLSVEGSFRDMVVRKKVVPTISAKVIGDIPDRSFKINGMIPELGLLKLVRFKQMAD
jgi:hypothetical protein